MSGKGAPAGTPKKVNKSSEMLKQLRKSAKSSFTRLLHKIKVKIKSRPSSETIIIVYFIYIAPFRQFDQGR